MAGTISNNHSKIQSIAILSVLTALVAAFTVIPYTGYITYGLVDITTLHIIVITGAIVLGPAKGAILGGAWGILCLLRATAFLGIPIYNYFLNPVISVLPRILVGLFAGLVYKMLKSRMRHAMAAVISAIVGSLTNTVFVISTLLFFLYITNIELFSTYLTTLVTWVSLFNGGLELAASIIIVPAVSLPLIKLNQKH